MEITRKGILRKLAGFQTSINQAKLFAAILRGKSMLVIWEKLLFPLLHLKQADFFSFLFFKSFFKKKKKKLHFIHSVSDLFDVYFIVK